MGLAVAKKAGAYPRLLASLLAMVVVGLLLLMTQAALRQVMLPSPREGQQGLLAQRYGDARLGGDPGPAYLEKRVQFSDAVDQDFQANDFSLRLTGYLTVWVPGP
jgi:hypothetical protein